MIEIQSRKMRLSSWKVVISGCQPDGRSSLCGLNLSVSTRLLNYVDLRGWQARFLPKQHLRVHRVKVYVRFLIDLTGMDHV